MTKIYKFAPSDVSERRSLKLATLRAGLRRALKGNKDVKLARRREETYLVRQAPK